MYFSGQWVPDGRTNKGVLIQPPVKLEALGLLQDGQLFSTEKLASRWAVIVFGSETCSTDKCQEVLYKTRQVHIGLGREADRVTRIYVSEKQPALDKALKDQHPSIFWLHADKRFVTRTLSTSNWPENSYFIVDPLGNIMMSYDASQEGGDLLRDMQKLLKASKTR